MPFCYVFEQIEKHELLEMRRVAAYIYKKASRWKQSIALSKKDNLYKDAMETASQSGDRELAEELLVYFIEQVPRMLGQSEDINLTKNMVFHNLKGIIHVETLLQAFKMSMHLMILTVLNFLYI